MDPVNRSITDYIKSGNYFIDSKNWYFRSFIYPIVERSVLGAISIIFIIILFQVLLTINSLFPIKQRIPLIIKLQDSNDKIPLISTISNKNENPQESVKKYLIKRYVENWESYQFDTVEKQINVIKNSSSKYIFKKFYNYISLNNPDSPLLYQKQISRMVQIISMDFDDDESNVVVQFTVNSIDNNTKNETLTRWIANINFQIEDIVTLMESKESKSLDFIVTDYQVRQVN
ncbi:MAG: VirB8/TrbF family protein [Alphaproteobacteria bacterium]